MVNVPALQFPDLSVPFNLAQSYGAGLRDRNAFADQQQRQQMNALALQDAQDQRSSRNALAQYAPQLADPATRQNAFAGIARTSPAALPDAAKVVAQFEALDEASQKRALEKGGLAAQTLGAIDSDPDDSRIIQTAQAGSAHLKSLNVDTTPLDQAIQSGDPGAIRRLAKFTVGMNTTLQQRQTQQNAARTYAETVRHNKADETNAATSRGTASAQLAETARHNKATEANTAAQQGTRITEDQAKSGGYADRAAEGDSILADPKVIDAGKNAFQHIRASAPGGNYLVSDDYQRYDQASRDFINAVLRRDSGAAISESEWDNARKQYLPQPGDSDTVLKQKTQNRKTSIGALTRSAGQSYKPQSATANAGGGSKAVRFEDLP